MQAENDELYLFQRRSDTPVPALLVGDEVTFGAEAVLKAKSDGGIVINEEKMLHLITVKPACYGNNHCF